MPLAPSASTNASEAAERQNIPIPETLPVLPVSQLVLFPHASFSLSVDQPAARRMLEESLPQSRIIGVFTQKEAKGGNGGGVHLHAVGVAARVQKLIRQDNGTLRVVLDVLARIEREELLAPPPFLRASVKARQDLVPAEDRRWKAVVAELRDRALKFAESIPDRLPNLAAEIARMQDPGQLADLVANSMALDTDQKQELLAEQDVGRRIRLVLQHIASQQQIARLRRKIHQDVTTRLTEAERREYLREQIKSIQRELGDEAGGDEQAAELRRHLQRADPPAAVLEHAERELQRMSQLNPATSEFSLLHTYLCILAELPWNRTTPEKLDLRRAQRILDRSHYDLEKVKRRLIEQIAVRQLNPTGQLPVLCFIGPPGVGKTSLGQSFADALGRKFVRLGLGGVRDESDIRGERRTYIGAMPGRIIQELRRAGTRNPVLMLDEVDKVGADFHGDPAYSLLEVIDAHQNHSFVDHYLDLPFDLSQVLFIATASYIDDVPYAIRDRLELVRIPGYSDREKLEIARRFLIPQQLKNAGLLSEQCRFDTPAITLIVDDYTREAGLRQLSRQISAMCRYTSAQIARGHTRDMRVNPALVHRVLGPPPYIRETRLKTANPGVVTGLAWTAAGGEIMHIEALRYQGKGGILLTGQIGNVMKESAQAAFSLAKSRIAELGIHQDAFRDYDVHIHVPAGAVSKDGPSAGVAMFTAIASLFTDRTVRATVAMTGEITLRGLVLPIGGLKEKILAAERAGIGTVIMPKLNEKDLVDLPDQVTRKMKTVMVETVDEVLAAALAPVKKKARTVTRKSRE